MIDQSELEAARQRPLNIAVDNLVQSMEALAEAGELEEFAENMLTTIGIVGGYINERRVAVWQDVYVLADAVQRQHDRQVTR